MQQAQATQPAGAVDREFVEGFGERWLAAWNSHEPDRVLELMTEDIVYDDSAWPTTMRGHGEVREFLEYTFRAFPDLRFELVDGVLLDPDAPRAAAYWRAFATNTGPLDPPGLAPTGKAVEMHGADFHEYRDGKLCRLRIVFDTGGPAVQMGLLPEPGSRGERLMTRVANLRRRFARG